ncbi:twin-arginine translocase TatA/TatE family subunit [Labilibacter sediminis]|nr:twin-arginine translocase TatA/TatE family subunit [Labilibacter sediminis]
MTFLFFSFSGGEIFLVVLAVLVLFGAKKIPELARTLGKGMNEFRKATDELKREFKDGTDDLARDFKESQEDIEAHVKEIGETITDTDSYEPYEELDEEQDNELTNNIDENSQARPSKKVNGQKESDTE